MLVLIIVVLAAALIYDVMLEVLGIISKQRKERDREQIRKLYRDYNERNQTNERKSNVR